jgi:hypothetical protein
MSSQCFSLMTALPGATVRDRTLPLPSSISICASVSPCARALHFSTF